MLPPPLQAVHEALFDGDADVAVDAAHTGQAVTEPFGLGGFGVKGATCRIGRSWADAVAQVEPVRSYQAGRKPGEDLCWSPRAEGSLDAAGHRPGWL